jgi:hypothetical protein
MKVLQHAIQKMLGQEPGEGGEDMAIFEVQQGDNEGEYLITLDEELLPVKEENAKPGTSGKRAISNGKGKTLEEALKVVGVDVRTLKGEFREMDKKVDEDDKDQKARGRDEL